MLSNSNQHSDMSFLSQYRKSNLNEPSLKKKRHEEMKVEPVIEGHMSSSDDEKEVIRKKRVKVSKFAHRKKPQTFKSYDSFGKGGRVKEESKED